MKTKIIIIFLHNSKYSDFLFLIIINNKIRIIKHFHKK